MYINIWEISNNVLVLSKNNTRLTKWTLNSSNSIKSSKFCLYLYSSVHDDVQIQMGTNRREQDGDEVIPSGVGCSIIIHYRICNLQFVSHVFHVQERLLLCQQMAKIHRLHSRSLQHDLLLETTLSICLGLPFVGI